MIAPRRFHKPVIRGTSGTRIVIGLTGGLGSGKSTVLGMFRGLGAKTADSDRIVQRLTAPTGEAYKKVVHLFGSEVLSPSGQLDKTAIARRVFREPRMRRKLEKVIHPLVVRELRREIRALKRGILVLDIPLLFEVGLQSLVDVTVCVWAPLNARLKRLEREGRFSTSDIRRRLKAQMPLQKKCRLADFVIDNSGRLPDTSRQLWDLFRRLAGQAHRLR